MLTISQCHSQRRSDRRIYRSSRQFSRCLGSLEEIPHVPATVPAVQGLPAHVRWFVRRCVAKSGPTIAVASVRPLTPHPAIIQADNASRRYDLETNPLKKQLAEEEKQQAELLAANKDGVTRAKEWATENRYSIVFGAWLASMGASFGIVARNPYLSTAQKIVQARVWAQGLTLAVLLASFALEANDANQGKGRWETVKVLDPNDPTHTHYVEKKIHHERYQGEDMWRGKLPPLLEHATYHGTNRLTSTQKWSRLKSAR